MTAHPRLLSGAVAAAALLLDLVTAAACYSWLHGWPSFAPLGRAWAHDLQTAAHGSDLVLLAMLRCFSNALAPVAFPWTPKRVHEYATASEELQHVWPDAWAAVRRDFLAGLAFTCAVGSALYTLLALGRACVGGATQPLPWWLLLAQTLVASSGCLVVAVWCHLLARRRRTHARRRRLSTGTDELREPLLHGVDEEEPGTPAVDPKHRLGTVKRLISLSRPDAGKMTVAFTCLVLAVCCDVAIPSFKADALNAILSSGAQSLDVTSGPGLNAFGRAVLSLAMASLGAGAFAGARGGLLSVCNVRLVARLQAALFAVLIRRGMASADALAVGKGLSRLTTDTGLVGDVLGLNVNVALRSILRLFLTTCYLATLSVPLTLVAIGTAVLFFGATAVYSHYQRVAARATQEATADSSACAEQSLSLLRTVRAFNAERHEEGRFTGALQRRVAVQEHLARVYTGYTVTQTVLDNAQAVLLLTLGGSLYAHGAVSGAVLSKFVFYTGVVSSSIQSTADMIGDTFRALGASDEVFRLLDEPPQADAVVESRDTFDPPPGCSHAVCRPAEASVAEASGARVDFRNVAFSYPGRAGVRVLDDVSFSVPPGAHLALVGGSGSGKSTCVALLLRFYRPTEGTITLNGHDIGKCSARWVRSLIAVVGQEPPLFNGSIRENIAYGCATASDAEVDHAARLACATGFISALPEGLRTVVGPKGVQLSGGQKQRVAIARAMVRNPRLLLLDEATSALDAASEADVQAALDIASEGRTVLVVAHRLSTVRGCGTIVVMSAGRVVESGSHAELLARQGAYHALVIQQLGRDEDGLPPQQGKGQTEVEDTEGAEPQGGGAHTEADQAAHATTLEL